MIWARKRIADGDLRSIELLFREQAAAFDEHKQMMLIKVEEDWPMLAVFVSALNEELLSPFHEFSFCTRRELPLVPTLVAGCRIRFCRTFESA